MTIPTSQESVIQDIISERRRQDAKWGAQNHSDFVWLAILSEEVGEAAQAILKVNDSAEGVNVWRQIRHSGRIDSGGSRYSCVVRSAATKGEDTMSRQISIRWNSDMGQDYQASISALQQYFEPPDIKVSARLKGDMPAGAVQDLVDLARNYDMEINVTLTATWDDEANVQQLRLFGPVPRLVTRDGEIVDEAVAL